MPKTAVIAADKHPVLPAWRLPAQLPLAPIIVERKMPLSSTASSLLALLLDEWNALT